MFKGNNTEQNYDVIIIGAGISGLSAAIRLQREGINFIIIEANDKVGGRMQTDYVKEYQLDHGFQVLLSAYPEAEELLDYNALNLKPFEPGAIVQYGYNKFQLSDPFRKPISALRHFRNPFTSITDIIKIVALRNRHNRLSIKEIFEQEEKQTIEFLKEWNFTDKFIESFLRPFLSGIFLDDKLSVSARMMEFVFKMFSQGYATLPEKGMQAIPDQLAKKIPADKIKLNTRVANVDQNSVMLADGTSLKTKGVIIATDALSANKIYPCNNNTSFNSVKNIYFSSDKAPFSEPVLYLNGNISGLVNNLAVPTNVHRSYAPKNKHLISVSVVKETNLNDLELIQAVRSELKVWFGVEVEDWLHLRTYNIDKALPNVEDMTYTDPKEVKAISKNIYQCGDHTHDPSINGAIRSGRLNAEAMIWQLSLKLS